MKCNVGGIDRTGRIVIGIVLLAIGLMVPMDTLWQVVLLVLAAIALVTAVVRFCPVNAAIGLNTCEQAKEEGGK